jgi:hypothetical protein
MIWSSKSLLGVLAANNLGSGLALAEICQTFGQASNSAKMAWHVQNQLFRAFMTWKHQSLDP